MAKTVHVMLETRAKVFFFAFAKVTFLSAKVSRKLDIVLILSRAATHCRPGSGRKGTGEFRFGSGSVACVVAS